MENGSSDSSRRGPELVNAIPQRDHEWFDALLLRYSPVLYRIAFRKLGNAEDAEDALQDALLSAFKNMHQFRGEARFSTCTRSRLVVIACSEMPVAVSRMTVLRPKVSMRRQSFSSRAVVYPSPQRIHKT